MIEPEEANIEMQIDEKKWTNHETGSPQFYIDYVGPLKGAISSRDLKIDITRGEIIETEIETKSIFRDYSDLEEAFHLKCSGKTNLLLKFMIYLILKKY